MKPIGHLEVIAGPMYCGKTEELIRLVKRATIGKKKVQVFKHKIDTRYGKDRKVYSHDGMTFKAILIDSASQIPKKLHKNTEIIAIDEAQWFGEDLVTVIENLLQNNRHVIISGLSMTYDRQPFVPMPTLMAMADKVTKLTSVCSICGADAVYHKRLSKNTAVDPLSTDPSLVGNTVYEARCRRCYSK